FVINRVTAVSMEPRGAVGDYNAADNHYTVYTAIQRPHPSRTDLATIIGVPESKVRIVTGDTGGSFGMKSPINPETPLVLLASKIVGRPVKWIATRSEGFTSDPQGRDNVTEAELALDKDGRFLGLRVKLMAAIGAYLQPAMPAFFLNAGTLAGCYRTPTIFVDVTGVYSHTNPVRPYRGNGRPEAAFIIERMVDIAADEMGIDPVELRRRNYIPPEAMPFKTGLTFTYDTGEFETNMDLALKLADAKGFRARKAESRKHGKLRGFGLSNTIERAAADLTEGAEIRFDRSGTVTMISGANSQGQGHETVFKQLVCDALGIDPSQVQYMQGDTDQIFYGVGTGGSRSSALAGSAFLRASEKVIAKSRRIAAHVMKVEADDLKYEEGVFSSGKTNLTLSIQEIARIAAEPSKLPKDMEAGLSQTAVFSGTAANYPNGCHVCEVEIERDTGKVQIVRYAVVDDVGTVLNPMLLHGQIHGGIAQGAGQILMENIAFDSEGQIVTGSFMDYAMPHAHDFPPIKIEAHPVPTPTNPLGVKGAGEAGTVGAMPAITNALVDALSEFGVRHVEMPATSEHLWRLMQGK
ncbi:MAG: molybdopterin cofactor-binding domain-containing protein, partial [Pseudolabrys sp.]